MSDTGRILIVQTAFIGDVILTTPLFDVLHSHFKDYEIDVVAIPAAANLLENHPAIREVIIYDKRGKDRGLSGIVLLQQRLRARQYDIAVIPHRSFRSGLICTFAGIHRRIAFSTSAARFLMTDIVKYRPDKHEVDRNLSLLAPLEIPVPQGALPSLYPSQFDSTAVSEFLKGFPDVQHDSLIALAPGSVWATKRWLLERFADLANHLIEQNFSVVLIGGTSDISLGHEMEARVGNARLINAIDKLSLLQSAEMIRRSRVLVSNDSAPLHMGVSMRTPVVAIFGATVPSFGFAPRGEHDEIVEVEGLTCRPCAIHGGHQCPIKTFDCMRRIQVEDVLQRIRRIVSAAGVPMA